MSPRPVVFYIGTFLFGLISGCGMTIVAGKLLMDGVSYSGDIAQGWYTVGVLNQMCTGDIHKARKVLDATLDATTVSVGLSLPDLSHKGRAQAVELLRAIRTYRSECSAQADDAVSESQVQQVLGTIPDE